jgi:hypothetical protein
MTGGILGWFVLCVLTLLATVDALGIALRTKPSGRAELAIMAAGAGFALVAGPVLVLGYANILTPGALASVSLVVLCGIFALLARGRGAAALLRGCATAARGIARMPFDALVETARARSVVFAGLVVSAGVLAAAFFLTVFAPNEAWDGLLYHEPIVGFAIQNHGFAVVPVPMNVSNQDINGYPHLCEAVMYWLVAFTDKTLIELPNELGALGMMLATYALAARFGDRLTAMGWACAIFLMPQAWSQLCQSLVDMIVAFFALLAVYFATRPTLRTVDAWCAILGMALLLGSKGSALLMVPPIALVAAARLLWPPLRPRLVPVLATVVGGAVLLAAIGAFVPLRNWAAFHDPLWPLTFESRALGVHWDGLTTVKEMATDRPLVELMAIALDVPVGGMSDVIPRGYGYALAWVVIPLGVVAGGAGLVAGALELKGWRERSAASNLALVLLLVIAGSLTTPTLSGQNARYNMHLVVGLMAAVSWMLARRRWDRLREAVLGATMALSIVPLFWMRGRGWYWVSTEHPEDVVLHPFDSRTQLARPSFDMLARQRNEELKAGDLAVFNQEMSFIGALWNFDFSNRVRYVKYEASRQFVETLDETGAKWAAVGKDGDARKTLERTGRWELVGPINPDGEVVFRRKKP